VVVSSLTLLIAFKLLIQPPATLVPDLWLEIKALNSVVATALTALYAIFTYPLALGVMVIQIVFAGARPVTNPANEKVLSWAGKSLLSLLWVCFTVMAIGLFIFGTTIHTTSKQPEPFSYLCNWMRESILEAILDY